MRRDIGIIISASLAVTAVCPVMAEETAEINLTYVAEFGDADWIRNTDLLAVGGYGQKAIADLEGNVLTEMCYSSLSGEYGYITAQKTDVEGINSTGMFREDGSELIPFVYGDIEILNTEWAAAFSLTTSNAEHYDYQSFWGDNTYWLIDTVDIYYLPEAKCVATLDRSSYGDAKAVGSKIAVQGRADESVTVYDSAFSVLESGIKNLYSDMESMPEKYTSFRENGQQGLMDADGNILMSPAYQYVNDYSIYGDCVVVSTGEKDGLVKIDGSVILPAEYDEILHSYYMNYDKETDRCYGYISHGFLGAVKDGKLAFYNTSGEETTAPKYKYSSSAVNFYGVSAILEGLEGKILLAADGTESSLDAYESIYPMEYTGGMYYTVHDADYNSGLIDWHGNVIVPLGYSSIEVSGDGRYLLTQKEYTDKYIVYELNYPDSSAEEDFPSEASTEDASSSEASTTEAETMEMITEVPSETTNADGQKDAVSILLEQATDLLVKDAEANKAAVISLLQGAKTLIGENAVVNPLLDSAVSLLEQDAAANADAVKTLISSAESLR